MRNKQKNQMNKQKKPATVKGSSKPHQGEKFVLEVEVCV